jgi:hypothetical protein
VTHSGARTVAVVLDASFSSRLPSLAERVAVWIVDSSENRPAIEALWSARRTRQATYDVTVFREIPGLSVEDHLAGVLRSIEMDTGVDEELPPLEWVEVYGVEPSDSIGSLLRARGFGGHAPLADGFRARKRREG